MVDVKIIRRSIIVICLLLLIPVISQLLPERKYLRTDIANMVRNGNAKAIEVNQSAKIDMDTLIIKSIINTSDETYIRYRVLEPGQGWNFPVSALKMYDEKGNSYMWNGGTGQGKLWGEECFYSYQKISSSSKEMVLKFEWYDRSVELRIPLEKSGGSNE